MKKEITITVHVSQEFLEETLTDLKEKVFEGISSEVDVYTGKEFEEIKYVFEFSFEEENFKEYDEVLLRAIEFKKQQIKDGRAAVSIDTKNCDVDEVLTEFDENTLEQIVYAMETVSALEELAEKQKKFNQFVVDVLEANDLISTKSTTPVLH